MKIDLNFYPGWVRKAFSFTIDDGNIPLDEKFIGIVGPQGFLGTFNLSSCDRAGYTKEDYRRVYRGFEIANHCKNHPQAIPDGADFIYSDEYFDKERAIADGKTLYRGKNKDGIWYLRAPNVKIGMQRFAKTEDYIRFIKEAQHELEAVFGEGSIGAFVWPYTEQNKNSAVMEYVKNAGFYAVRKTGNIGASTGFSIPEERFGWIYNCGYSNITEIADAFDKFEDDGELKVCFFGIHSHDFENNGKWGDLQAFADKYGNRPESFWYATNKEIFDYADAVKSVTVNENEVYNPSDITLYIKIDGVRKTLHPGSRIPLI